MTAWKNYLSTKFLPKDVKDYSEIPHKKRKNWDIKFLGPIIAKFTEEKMKEVKHFILKFKN